MFWLISIVIDFCVVPLNLLGVTLIALNAHIWHMGHFIICREILNTSLPLVLILPFCKTHHKLIIQEDFANDAQVISHSYNWRDVNFRVTIKA